MQSTSVLTSHVLESNAVGRESLRLVKFQGAMVTKECWRVSRFLIMNKRMLIFVPIIGKHLLIDLVGKIIIGEGREQNMSTYREIDDMTVAFEKAEINEIWTLPSSKTEIMVLWKSSSAVKYMHLIERPDTILNPYLHK